MVDVPCFQIEVAGRRFLFAMDDKTQVQAWWVWRGAPCALDAVWAACCVLDTYHEYNFCLFVCLPCRARGVTRARRIDAIYATSQLPTISHGEVVARRGWVHKADKRGRNWKRRCGGGVCGGAGAPSPPHTHPPSPPPLQVVCFRP